MSNIKKKKQYAYQPVENLLKPQTNHTEKYTELCTKKPIIYDSLGECRANIIPTVYNDYLVYAFFQFDASKQSEHISENGINPATIDGLVVNITNIHTGQNDIIAMPIDTPSGFVDLTNMREAIQEYRFSRGAPDSTKLPDGIQIKTIRAAEGLSPMFAEHLGQQLGMQQNDEKFMRHFAMELCVAEGQSWYECLVNASTEIAFYYGKTTNIQSVVNAAQQAMESELAKRPWHTQVAWQLSNLPDGLAATMRERAIGESALLREQGYSVDQANALALLKVVNNECHAAARNDEIEYREQLGAVKEQAARLAVDAGCSKEAMIAVTRKTIDTQLSDYSENNAHIMHVAIGKAFNQAVISNNHIGYLATLNQLYHMSHTMYDDKTPLAANAQDDLQERIDKNASQLQKILASDNKSSLVIPTAADVINRLEYQLANNCESWVEYMSQYAILMPIEMHETFLKHCKDALDELNAFTDGTTRAAMSKAAYTAIQEMMTDRSLPTATQQILNNLSTKASEHAVAAGADIGDFNDLSQDDLEEIGDD
jgi:hypothetical protein